MQCAQKAPLAEKLEHGYGWVRLWDGEDGHGLAAMALIIAHCAMWKI